MSLVEPGALFRCHGSSTVVMTQIYGRQTDVNDVYARYLEVDDDGQTRFDWDWLGSIEDRIRNDDWVRLDA